MAKLLDERPVAGNEGGARWTLATSRDLIYDASFVHWTLEPRSPPGLDSAEA